MRAVAAALLLAAGPARAGGGPGTAVAPVFKLGVGARAAGMGDAFVSLADDAEASAWNPAGLARVPRKTVSLMHFSLFEDVNYEYLGYAHPVGRGGVGGHLAYLFTDAIPRTVEDAGGAFDPARSGGTFRNSELKLNLAGGWAPAEWAAVGAGGSYFQDRVDKDTADGFMGDLGALLRPHPRVWAGAALQNWGPAIRGGARPPAQTRFGAHWSPREGSIIAAGSSFAHDSDRRAFSLGVEQWFNGVGAVRGGYRFGDRRDAGGNRFSAGLGLRLGSTRVDYAFSPMGELGHTHRAALSFAFGASREGGEDPPPERPRRASRAPRRASAEDHLRQAEELIERESFALARSELTAASRALKEDDPLVVDVHTLTGRAALRENELAAAKEAFLKALSAARRGRFEGEAVAEAYAGLGFCLLREGDKARAGEFFRRALDAEPSPEVRASAEAELRRLKSRK